MTKPLFPCCYYPTTLVLVDDLYKFLKNFQLSLSANYLCESFQKPETALRALQEKTYLDPVRLNWVVEPEDDEYDLDRPDHKTLAIDFKAIRKQIYNPRRFSETAVVLIDYAMPSMDGLAFCRHLKNFPLKKIMITGEADYALAVNAFNEGIIDKFINKNDQHFFKKVNEAISDLEMEYFNQVSGPVSKNLVFSKQFSGNDEAIKNAFEKARKENKIIEYYLIDNFGSYLMLDEKANITWFIIKPENELQKFLDIAKGNNAPDDIIFDLENRKKIPFFLTEEDESVPVKEWRKYLHPAAKISAKTGKYYLATITSVGLYNTEKKAIKSYMKYLNLLN